MLDSAFQSAIPRQRAALAQSTQARVEQKRRHAEAELNYYLHTAPPEAEYLPTVRAHYFQRWMDAEAVFYNELIPTDEEIEIWLHDLTHRTLNHQHGSTIGMQFEPDILARRNYWSEILDESRFKDEALSAHFRTAAGELELELNRARSNMLGVAADSADLTSVDPDGEIFAAITRLFKALIVRVLSAFQGATSRSVSYRMLAASLENCFLTSLEQCPMLWSCSSILYPFISGETWLDKERKAEIRKICKNMLTQYEAEFFSRPADFGGASPNHRILEAATPKDNMLAQEIKSQNRGAVDNYIRRVRQVIGRKITRDDINRVAGYKNPTTFQRWQRMDKRSKPAEGRKFERTLALAPKEFVERLNKTK